MSATEQSTSFVPGSNSKRVQLALERLLVELEPFHGNDTALHQLWLEIQWLAANAAGGTVSLPRWQLILFQMVDKPPLSRLKAANQAAAAVAQLLRESDVA
jgi:hypothetical protein